MSKLITAVEPYVYPQGVNFKDKAFEAWPGTRVKGWYPRFLHGLMFRMEIPTLWRGNVRLVFTQPVTLRFDTFCCALNHELIPFLWDCWPRYDDLLVGWLRRHRVRMAIFTSSEAAKRIRQRLPRLHTLFCPEAILTENYKEGLPLAERDIDVFHFGRMPQWVNALVHSPLKVVQGGTNEEFHTRLQHARITIAVPRCDVSAEATGGQETLTQRYWECMLSRMVMVGRAPHELIDLIGYDPVVAVDTHDPLQQMQYITQHIEQYQELVDRNRETALRMGDWQKRMEWVSDEIQRFLNP